ncbi:hypothetical protein MTR_6g088960 [Medicago truncatula]|uniref:Uncharacterized protein n=1 Tax=Medicago truncatula TaxID=3880 RepID=G7KPX9_MEDTR|nr:hypothetical protein MTR_6g088960 [Medicago truncatula]
MDEGQSADGNEDIHQIKLSKTSKSNRRNTKNDNHALVTIQDSKGLFDLIISKFHIFEMNVFEFQKKIQDEFQLPDIG